MQVKKPVKGLKSQKLASKIEYDFEKFSAFEDTDTSGQTKKLSEQKLDMKEQIRKMQTTIIEEEKTIDGNGTTFEKKVLKENLPTHTSSSQISLEHSTCSRVFQGLNAPPS